MKELVDFPESRYRHCYSVGKKMYDYAERKLGWDKTKCLNMFVLGNLHDIGYEYDSDSYGHGYLLGHALKYTYAYNEEIYYHNDFLKNASIELQLLYFADATVDSVGNWVTYEERINDLISRHGKTSKVVADTITIIENLKRLGFDDSLD